MACKIGDTEEAHRHGTGQGQDHPRHADAASVRDGLHRVGGHEAHQDVRLSEVAEAPGQQRDDGNEGQPVEHIEGGRVLSRDCVHRSAHVAQRQDHEHRGDQQREDHQGGLHSVSPADREEAADEHVKNGGCCTDPQRDVVRHPEAAFEQPRTSHDTRGAVDGEEHQHDQRREDAQHAAFIFETVREIVRQGQRILVALGVYTQASGYEQPVQPGTGDQADGDPAFRKTGDENCARQTHQQPAAHVRSAGRQRRDKTAQATSPEDVVVEVLGCTVGDKADQQHRADVDHERDQSWSTDAHFVPSLVVVDGREGIPDPTWQRAMAVRAITGTGSNEPIRGGRAIRQLFWLF